LLSRPAGLLLPCLELAVEWGGVRVGRQEAVESGDAHKLAKEGASDGSC
jgi:hypothetical protein